MGTKNNYSEIRLFSAFTAALTKLESADKPVYGFRRLRAAFCHRLGIRLEEALPELFSDLDADNGADLVLTDRGGFCAMSVVVRTDYLTQRDQKKLMALSDTGTLALGISLFPSKDYILVYRALSRKIEYYHFDRTWFTMDSLKNKELPDNSPDPQLSLIKAPRTKKAKIEEKARDGE